MSQPNPADLARVKYFDEIRQLKDKRDLYEKALDIVLQEIYGKLPCIAREKVIPQVKVWALQKATASTEGIDIQDIIYDWLVLSQNN